MVTGAERTRLARTFGARLAGERRRAGLTQDRLAAQAGYSAAHVARLERGERRPTDSTTWRLARAITETRRGTTAAVVELDVALIAAAGESLRVRYQHRPRLHRQRLIQQTLDLEQVRQQQREQSAGLTEAEQLAAMVTAMFDAERRAPR